MSIEYCILTPGGLALLKAMRARGGPHLCLVNRKIAGAIVVPRDEIPGDVATLSSRVTFRVDCRPPEMRVISREGVISPVGMCLPIGTRRALALLGLAEGQAICLTAHGDDEERILLQKVHYQPEATSAAHARAARARVPVEG